MLFIISIDSSTGPVEKEDLPPGFDDETESQPESGVVLRKHSTVQFKP